MKIKRASKYGFCSGVRVADIKVKRFAQSATPGAILGQVVHNERVVDEMAQLGVRTVHALDEVSEPVVVFSAHGVPPSFHREARRRGLYRPGPDEAKPRQLSLFDDWACGVDRRER